MKHNYGEKEKEYNKKLGKEVDVWQSPKYRESKAKADELIDSGKYGLSEADFWILMNSTKSGKMAYTGLIISHNGCLKINDALAEEKRFVPSCVSIDKDGYNGSLVYTYSNDKQGIYEVGEVTQKNCDNAYPYAMAFKRCFDRVVLKNSKVAYAGIYSDSEADEFREQPDERKETKKTFVCEKCGKVIEDYTTDDGKVVPAEKVAAKSMKKYKKVYCLDCIEELNSMFQTVAEAVENENGESKSA